MLFQTLLTIHIVAGFSALLTAFAAIFSKTLQMPHRWHVLSGRIFFGGMLGVFLTALPITFLRPNLFLFLIAIFSFYQAFSGWRYAKNRRGTPATIDWVSTLAMALTGLAMVSYGTYILLHGNSNGVTQTVFGLIGLVQSYTDVQRWRHNTARGPQRIAYHLSSMMGATIATLTAFIVTNLTFEPAFVLWLVPTVLLAPIIIWWNIQLRQGRNVQHAEAIA